MIKDIYYKYLQNQLKIDQHCSMKLYKEKTIKGLELGISKVCLHVLNKNRQKEET